MILKISYFLRKKYIYDNTVAGKSNGINTLNNKIKQDKSTHHFKIENRTPINFNDFDHPVRFIRKIKDSYIDLEKSKKMKKKKKLNQIYMKQQKENRSINQKSKNMQ